MEIIKIEDSDPMNFMELLLLAVKSKFVCKIPVEKVWSYMSRITLLVGAPLDVRQAWYSSIQR